jgi:DNA-directed RNA polymerase
MGKAKAKERLQFYAFALEWRQYRDHVRSGGEPAEFISRLPCGQDHTCSGVQHIAALWRNETLARASNVLPGEPRDFYQEVTDKVVQELEDRAGDGVEQARRWLKVTDQIITRSLIKKFAMTFDYGATSFGFGADIGAYVREQAKDDPELQERQPMYWPDADDLFEAEPGPPPESDWRPPRTEEEREEQEALRQRCETGNPWDGDDPDFLKVLDEAHDQYELSVIGTANNYLAQITERVLEQVTEARDWFRACAKAIAETNSPVSWTVPITGFEVVQNGWKYMKKERDGRPRAGGRQLVVLKLTDDVLLLKQKNGAAPNVIHSLDAANLVLTISSLPKELPLGTAHDCYYTLAADADRVNQAARSAFVRLHSEPILDDLHAQFSALAGRNLPKPRKGRLDIEAALDSEYMLS